jgi:DNA primase
MENKMNCEEAKKIDMVDYLAKAGHHPEKIRDNNYWYRSPFRNEKTASFKINRRINRWYDHGIGKGGNLVDFALLFHNCKISDWLNSLKGDFLPHEPPLNAIKEYEKLIAVQDAIPFASEALLNYLKSRNISLSIARKFCVELHYAFRERNYYGIGFKNDLNGYEIRNPFYKNSSGPKGITTIKNSTKKVAVFEGFFDFLSFISMLEKTGDNSYSFCVLNSLSFFESARIFLESYTCIHLFLDNDDAGRNCTAHALRLHPKYMDGRKLYKGFKDVNDWWMNRILPP